MTYLNHKNHILSFTNVFTAKECKKVVEFIKKNIDKFEKSNQGERSPTTSNQLHITNLYKELQFDEIDQIIYDGLAKVTGNAVSKGQRFPCDRLSDTGYILREVTGPTAMHSDGIAMEYSSKTKLSSYRVASLIVSLEDTGDKLSFPEYNLDIPLREGTVVFFPPFWTHRHGTEWSGKKGYRIQTWLKNSFGESVLNEG